MLDRAQTASRPQLTPPRIGAWRARTARLRRLVHMARVSGTIRPGLLQKIDQASGGIYAEIASYDALARHARTSPKAAAELAEVNDTLQLVLMEIGELGTELCAARSG
jgi:hypothetical protein